MVKEKYKPTSQAWEELVEQRQAQSIKNNEVANNANHAHALEQVTQQVRHEVNHARYKFKRQPYGKGSSQLMSDQGDLFKHQSFGADPDKHPKFSRGLVRKNIGGVEFMLPAKKGSGSRGSPGWKK